jgi:putative cell wall-binding protein
MAVTKSKIVKGKSSVKKNAGKKSTKKAASKKAAKTAKKWSADVMKHSNALDLESHVFESDDPKKVAQSLKRSAEKSKRRKGTPYQSAMSMLSFYINRAGKKLESHQKQVLEKAKRELRQAFGRDESGKKKRK